MRALATAGLMACLAGIPPAAAQQPPAPQEDPVERQIERLKDRVRITDEQVPKIRELLKKQTDDLKGQLTDEQKRLYDEMNRSSMRFSGGSTRSSSWWPSVDDMRGPLQLTETQATKINEIRDALRQELRNYFTTRPQGGNNSREEYEAFQKKVREDNTKKIRDVMTDVQKPKFDEILQEYVANQESGADRGGPRGRGPSVEDRLRVAMEGLKIDNATEEEAIKGVVKKVIEAMEKLEQFQRSGRDKLEEAARNKDLSDTAVEARLEEFRTAQRDLEKELSTARRQLAAVVTSRQELELIRRGVLK